MEIKTINGKIFPTNPFDFSKSLNFINKFAPTEGEQSTNDLSFTKAVYMEDQTLAFRIEDEGQLKNRF